MLDNMETGPIKTPVQQTIINSDQMQLPPGAADLEMTYRWEINELKTSDVKSLNNVVVVVKWMKIGTDKDGNEGVFAGTTPFKNVDANNFIEFEQLSEEIVLGWVKAVVVGSYENHVDTKIIESILSKKTPKVAKPLPWAPIINT